LLTKPKAGCQSCTRLCESAKLARHENQKGMHTQINEYSIAQDKWETHVAREVVAGALAVELAEAVADVAAGLVVRHELLGLEAGGAGIAHVDARHHAGGSSKNLCAEIVSTTPERTGNAKS